MRSHSDTTTDTDCIPELLGATQTRRQLCRRSGLTSGSMADIQELAARRLAALGDKFLGAFDDADSDQEAAVAAKQDQQLAASSRQFERDGASSSSAFDSGSGGGDAPSSEEEDGTGAAPVFEFDRKTVRPQAHRHGGAATSSGGGPMSSGKGGRGRGKPAAAAEMANGTQDLSTWTGSRSELQTLQRQVQTYGAAALDKKSKKQFAATELARLGARADKAPRMPASVGKGLKRKHNARADRAQEEAIEAGHTSRAAIAKLRRAAKSAAHKPERGLLEDGGAFRGGVMRVSGKVGGGKPKAGGKPRFNGKRERKSK